MKLALWLVVGLAAIVWTGGAFLAAELTEWAVQALGSGQAEGLAKGVAQWPVPQWVSLWINPALIQEMQSAVLWIVEVLSDSMPLVESALGWLVTIVWLLWGLGLVAMLLVAFSAHVFLRRVGSARSRGV